MAGFGGTPSIELVRRDVPIARRPIAHRAASPSRTAELKDRPELRPESAAEANLRRTQRAEVLGEIEGNRNVERPRRIDIVPSVTGMNDGFRPHPMDRTFGARSREIDSIGRTRDVTPVALVATESGRIFAILPHRRAIAVIESPVELRPALGKPTPIAASISDGDRAIASLASLASLLPLIAGMGSHTGTRPSDERSEDADQILVAGIADANVLFGQTSLSWQLKRLGREIAREARDKDMQAIARRIRAEQEELLAA